MNLCQLFPICCPSGEYQHTGIKTQVNPSLASKNVDFKGNNK